MFVVVGYNVWTTRRSFKNIKKKLLSKMSIKLNYQPNKQRQELPSAKLLKEQNRVLFLKTPKNREISKQKIDEFLISCHFKKPQNLSFEAIAKTLKLQYYVVAAFTMYYFSTFILLFSLIFMLMIYFME